ncbi:MAG: sigma-54 dependent transcriptional regulator [Firmicutes bacterium]|nr:sigma-54 dependent transcriptional regulator [Bacillota bacterium]
MPFILLVEDDPVFSGALKKWLTQRNYTVTSVSSLKAAKDSISQQAYDLIITDLRLPSEEDGIVLIGWSKTYYPDIPVIMITHYADHQTAVKAIKSGASDYLAKPVNLHILEEIILKYIRIPVRTKKVHSDPHRYITGKHPLMQEVYEQVGIVAPTNLNVLITGSSGTGKEHIARLIHEQSHRRDALFVSVDCGAISKDLARSEFFGHMKGSFTSAIQDKEGAFVFADGGTLFLYEIGNLPYEVQVQLLRAIQEQKIKPVGSNQEQRVDVRLIVATNEDLRQAISGKYFREDLYYRVNEFNICLPDLKERQEDIPLFAEYFLEQSNQELQKQVKGFAAQTLEIFMNYPWPGNIRQLKNEVRRSTLLAKGKYILPEDLTKEIRIGLHIETPALSKWQLQEANIIQTALRENGNNKSRAARQIGIDRKTLYNKIKTYNISPE